MKPHLFVILCHSLGVIAYKSLPRDNFLTKMLDSKDYNARLNSIDPIGEAVSQPQPHVTCIGGECTYAFTVTADNHVTGKCNSSTQEINTRISDLSQKLDAVLTVVERKSEADHLRIVDHQVVALKRQLKSERLRRNKLEGQLKRYRQTCRRNGTKAYQPVVRDCQDVYDYVSRRHSIYQIQPKNSAKISVYCEDGWTVFQHREDGTVDFNRNWEEYKAGFGNPSSEHWLGNENIYKLSRQKKYKLMVELGDWDGRMANAIYDFFRIDNEEGLYSLHIGEYVTGAGRDGLRFQENIGHGGSVNGMAFSTRDRDNDRSTRNCAELYRGGWWYNDCFWSNLNGDYVYRGGMYSDKFTWFPWKMNHYSLKTSKMKLKPT